MEDGEGDGGHPQVDEHKSLRACSVASGAIGGFGGGTLEQPEAAAGRPVARPLLAGVTNTLSRPACPKEAQRPRSRVSGSEGAAWTIPARP